MDILSTSELESDSSQSDDVSIISQAQLKDYLPSPTQDSEHKSIVTPVDSFHTMPISLPLTRRTTLIKKISSTNIQNMPKDECHCLIT